MTTSNGPVDPAFDAILETFFSLPLADQKAHVQAYLAEYPQYADRLRAVFDDSAFIDEKLAAAGLVARPRSAGERTYPALAGYQVLAEIGEGSQGVIYKALQIRTQRTVALKVLRYGAFATAKSRLRFDNEIQALARLRHPNLVCAYDSGHEQGCDYLAMEYADGMPLSRFLDENDISVPEALAIFLKISDAVSYAHQQGVLHRDLKPSNVIVDRQREPRVLDFGLAKLIDRTGPAITETGTFTGTLCFAAPEQIAGGSDKADVRADVYALGMILFELLTRKYPYPIAGQSHDRIPLIIQHTPPRRPSLFRSETGDELDTIVLRALEKDPERRYQSAAALRDDVRRFLSGEAIEAKRDSAWYVLRKTLGRHRWALTGVGIGLALLLGFSITITFLYGRARTAQATTEARAAMVRRSQTYTTRRLDALSTLANATVAFMEENPASFISQRLAKPVIPVPRQLLDRLPNAPELRVFSGDGSEERDAWVSENIPLLNELAGAVAAGRWRFGLDAGDGERMIEFRELDLDAGLRLCTAFASLAALHARNEDHDLAVNALRSGLSLGLDLGDEVGLGYKAAATGCRISLYEGFLRILEGLTVDPTRAKPYVDWLKSDPPVSTYEHVLAAERLKALQFLQDAVVESVPGGPGHLDVSALDHAMGGMYSRLGLATPVILAEAKRIHPAQYIAALDRLTSELPDSRSNGGTNDDLAAKLVRPLLPSIGTANHRHARDLRAASHTMGEVFDFRLRSGSWPLDLHQASTESQARVNPATGLGLSCPSRVGD